MSRKIPSFPSKATLEATDELLLTDTVAGVSKKVTADNLATAVDKGVLSGELVSADADNEIVQGSDELLYTSSPVQTVHGRSGDVVSANGDYNASQVTNAFDKTADTADDVTEGSTNLYNKLPAGGSTGQVLQKVDGTDFNIEWASSTVQNATTTVSGVVELATQTEIEDEDATGGTGASLTATPATMKYHKGVSSAWAKFNGKSDTINESYNVSSITDVGTGMYDVNYINDMASASYVVLPTCSVVAGDDGGNSDATDRLYAGFMVVSRTTVPTASKCRIVHANSYYTPAYEPDDVYVAIFGDLA